MNQGDRFASNKGFTIAITEISASTAAKSDVVRYQQKLAADLAAKAAEKVISADQNKVVAAQLALQQAQQAKQVAQTVKVQQTKQTEQVSTAKSTTGTGASGLTATGSAVAGTVDMTM